MICRRGSGFSRIRRNQKSAPSCTRLAHEIEAGVGVLRPFDDDVLEQIAEVRLDRAFVSGLDLEIVGNGALLIDLAVRLRENRARRVSV